MKKILYFYFLIFSFSVNAEFTSNDSYNVNEIKNIANYIELDTSALRDNSAYIREGVIKISTWKDLIEGIENESSTIRSHTTYFYNVLSSLSQTYPTISESSWFGQLLKNTKDLKDKLDSLASDLSEIKYTVDNIDTNVGIIKDNVASIDANVGTIKGNVSSIDANVGTIKGNVSSIDTNVYTIKDNTTSIKDDVSTISEYQAQILKAIQVGDTNMYRAFFNPASTLNYSIWYDSTYDFNSLDSNFGELPLRITTTSTPSSSQSFIESLFKYLPHNIQQIIQLTQLQNVANLNLQNIRKSGIGTITNQLDHLAIITNQLDQILAKIGSSSSTNSEEAVELAQLQFQDLKKYIQSESLENNLQINEIYFDGSFRKKILDLLHYQTQVNISQNNASLSLLTNLQCIVKSSQAEQQKQVDEFQNYVDESKEQAEDAISTHFENNSTLDGIFKNQNESSDKYSKSQLPDFKSLSSSELPNSVGFTIPPIYLNSDISGSMELNVESSLDNPTVKNMLGAIRFLCTLICWFLGLFASYIIIGYQLTFLSWCTGFLKKPGENFLVLGQGIY